MSIGEAHRFMLKVRGDAALRARVAALGDDPSIDALIALAETSGAYFNAADLRAAHRHDWMLRRIAGEPTDAPASRPSTGTSAR